MTHRFGRTLRDVTYGIIKTPEDGGDHSVLVAPSGSRVLWADGTNAGHEGAYGGRLLYWVLLPDYTMGGHGAASCGLQLGVDFEWEE